MGFAAPGPYRIPNCWVDAYAVYTNTPPNGAFRGFGQMQSCWASERTMDALAAKLDLEPDRAAEAELDRRWGRVRDGGDDA